jgi:ABC-type glutathione transport system ATPase component
MPGSCAAHARRAPAALPGAVTPAETRVLGGANRPVPQQGESDDRSNHNWTTDGADAIIALHCREELYLSHDGEGVLVKGDALGSSGNEDVVRLSGVTKRYGGRSTAVTALNDITLGFGRGSFTAVMGPSGSGKSTLLHCAAGLDRPTAGTVTLDGTDLTSRPERALARIRRKRIGFVFQSFNLLPELSAADNVALPLRLSGKHPRRAAVTAALDQVGLAGKRRSRPGQLSGGQTARRS